MDSMPGIIFLPCTAWYGNAIHLNSAEFHLPCSFIYETCSLFSRTSVFRSLSLSLWFLASHVFLAIFPFRAAAAFHVSPLCGHCSIECRAVRCCCWHVHHSIAAISVICKFNHGQWQPLDSIKLDTGKQRERDEAKRQNGQAGCAVCFRFLLLVIHGHRAEKQFKNEIACNRIRQASDDMATFASIGAQHK